MDDKSVIHINNKILFNPKKEIMKISSKWMKMENDFKISDITHVFS